MKIAIVGATGLVGTKILEVLKNRKFPVDEVLAVASAKSVGKIVNWGAEEIEVVSMETGLAAKPDIAIFSAGAAVSLEWAPKFAAVGTYVIDNSSAWRMHSDHKLIVPEINGDILSTEDRIIANPNCSTIQMVLALAPLEKEVGIERIVVSTYQSVSGSGQAAMTQLRNERQGVHAERCYTYQIDLNLIPQIDDFMEDGYTKEERKMMDETKKILDNPKIAVSATTVRVPVTAGHSESVNVTLKKDMSVDEIRRCMADMPGIVVVDDPKNLRYPMPLDAEGKEEVFVGRIRKDSSYPRSFNCWIVADNLLKGAATNAVQIAEKLLSEELV